MLIIHILCPFFADKLIAENADLQKKLKAQSRRQEENLIDINARELNVSDREIQLKIDQDRCNTESRQATVDRDANQIERTRLQDLSRDIDIQRRLLDERSSHLGAEDARLMRLKDDLNDRETRLQRRQVELDRDRADYERNACTLTRNQTEVDGLRRQYESANSQIATRVNDLNNRQALLDQRDQSITDRERLVIFYQHRQPSSTLYTMLGKNFENLCDYNRLGKIADMSDCPNCRSPINYIELRYNV